MSTRYAQTNSQGPPIHVNDQAANPAETENSLVFTGNSTPTGNLETGSWVAVSPNTHSSDSDFEAYHADNDDDTFDSPFEDQDEGSVRESRLNNSEVEEALRQSLSTLLATAAQPKFRQARAAQDNAGHGAFLSLRDPSPFLGTIRDSSPNRQHYEEGSASVLQNQEVSGQEAKSTHSAVQDLPDPPFAMSNSSEKRQIPMHSRPTIHHRTSAPRRHGTITPPYQDKAQAMIERNFNLDKPRPDSTSTSPDASSIAEGSLKGGNLEDVKLKNTNDLHPSEEARSSTSSSKSRKRKSPKRSSGEGSGRNRPHRGSTLVSQTDYLSESSSFSESKDKPISRRDDDHNDDSRWYTGDITVKVWTAAVISGVLLGAGFGAGTIWRGGRGGHYTTASA